jgi:hypothetical protein
MADTRDYSKDLSTTALAKALNKTTQEMFQQLVAMGLIVNNRDTWDLTPNGKAKGGLYKDGGAKIGRYIVWPETIVKEFHAPPAPQVNQPTNRSYNVPPSSPKTFVSEPAAITKDNNKDHPHINRDHYRQRIQYAAKPY